jgi:hypothetical protein
MSQTPPAVIAFANLAMRANVAFGIESDGIAKPAA